MASKFKIKKKIRILTNTVNFIIILGKSKKKKKDKNYNNFTFIQPVDRQTYAWKGERPNKI